LERLSTSATTGMSSSATKPVLGDDGVEDRQQRPALTGVPLSERADSLRPFRHAVLVMALVHRGLLKRRR
jgi:hypothetical protein